MSTDRSRRWLTASVAAAMLIVAACGGASGTTASSPATLDDPAASTPATAGAAIADDPDPDLTPASDPTTAPEPDLMAPASDPTAEPTVAPDPDGEGEGERDFSAVTEAVQAFVDRRGLNGAGLIVVHRDDGVIYHEHFGEFTPDRVSLIASSSKMISAGVLMKLHEQGLLDLDAPVVDAVPWESSNVAITPAQLVSNSSGLVGLGPDLLYSPYICQWVATFELEECARRVMATAADDADVIAPDTAFRYGGAQWQVAGGVAEAVSGKSWAELIDEIYAEPCGVDSLGYLSLGAVATGLGGYPTKFGGDPDSVAPTLNPSIEGGAYITTGDYGELLLMHLRGGRCGDTQVLSQASLDTMHADRVALVYDGDAAGPATGYGMGWWVNRTTGQISDGGAFGTVPWLDLDDGYGAYLVVEDSAQAGGELAAIINPLVHGAVIGNS